MTALEELFAWLKKTRGGNSVVKNAERELHQLEKRVAELEKGLKSFLIVVDLDDLHETQDTNPIIERMERIGEEQRWYSGEDLTKWATEQARRLVGDDRQKHE